MGYVLGSDGFGRVVGRLLETYRIYAPVVKTGAGRFTDTDVVMYDEVHSAEEIDKMLANGGFQQSVHALAWLLYKQQA